MKHGGFDDFPLDDYDYLIILSIGDKKIEGWRIQNTVFLLSKLLGIETDHFSGFSETVQERLNSRSRSQIFSKVGDKYVLTDLGLKIYDEFVRKVTVGEDSVLLKLLDTIRKMKRKDLINMIKFLYPEEFWEPTT
jgi:hypothetical protein